MQAIRALIVVALVSGLGIPEAARGEDAGLEPFYGTYTGTSLYPTQEGRPRELTLSIGPAGDDGFIVEWQTTFYKLEEDPRRKTQALVFRRTAPDARTFRAVPSVQSTGMVPDSDPLVGAPFAWARQIDRLLTVNVLTIDENGDYVVQTYDRALTKDGLGLTFVRVRNGRTEQRLWATLERQGD